MNKKERAENYMKLKCTLCNEIVEAEEFFAENENGEINVRCPNECLIASYPIESFSDIEVVEGWHYTSCMV